MQVMKNAVVTIANQSLVKEKATIDNCVATLTQDDVDIATEKALAIRFICKPTQAPAEQFPWWC
jgi:hypothetical protein